MSDPARDNEFCDDVLYISKSQNKVVLPYKVSELEKAVSSSTAKYKSLQEIIDAEYTVPLDRYRCGFFSRFKEGFAFMRQKQKSSFFRAVDLAFELMFTRYLHPSVITACKNLDELDIYLDCLNTNELDDFPFFKVRCDLYD